MLFFILRFLFVVIFFVLCFIGVFLIYGFRSSVYRRHELIMKNRTGLTSEEQVQFLQSCLANRVGTMGSIVEVGVWKGETLCDMAKAAPNRAVYGIDTFQSSFPFPSHAKDWAVYPFLWRLYRNTMSLSSVQKKTSELNRDREPKFTIHLIKEDIRNMCRWKHGPIFLLRCDVDTYAGTLASLKKLEPFVVKGGWVIIDDMKNKHVQVREAVQTYFSAMASSPRHFIDIDANAIGWQK